MELNENALAILEFMSRLTLSLPDKLDEEFIQRTKELRRLTGSDFRTCQMEALREMYAEAKD